MSFREIVPIKQSSSGPSNSTSKLPPLISNACLIGFFSVFFYLPPIFEKRREVLFWGPSPSLPSPPSKPTFCLISRLLLKLAFLNLACAKYAKTILLKRF